MAHFTRREFLKTGLAAGTLAVSGAVPLNAQRRSATDLVTLGRSGLKVTPACVRHRHHERPGAARARAGRFHAAGSPCLRSRHPLLRDIRIVRRDARMLGVALKGIPRDSYQLMSKVTTRDGVDPQQKFDELRRLANTEYFDIMLLHWQHTATWPADTGRWQDAILEVQSKKVVLSHGARCTDCRPCAGFPATSGSRSR